MCVLQHWRFDPPPWTFIVLNIHCKGNAYILTPTPSCVPEACSGFCEPGEPWWYPSAPQVPHAAAACSGGSETLNPDPMSPLPDCKAHQSWLLEEADSGTQQRLEGPAGSWSVSLVLGHDELQGWASSRPRALGGTGRNGRAFVRPDHRWMECADWVWGGGTGLN